MSTINTCSNVIRAQHAVNDNWLEFVILRKRNLIEMAEASDAVFKDLSGDDAEQGTTEIESCCMNCYKNVSLIVGQYRFKMKIYPI